MKSESVQSPGKNRDMSVNRDPSENVNNGKIEDAYDSSVKRIPASHL